VTGITDERAEARATADACVATLLKANPRMAVVVTIGPEGCYGYAGGTYEHVPALPTAVVSTAGAGDALLAGVMWGWHAVALLKGLSDAHFGETP